MMERSRSEQDIISILQNELKDVNQRLDIVSTRASRPETLTWLNLGIDIPYLGGCSNYAAEWGMLPAPSTGIAKLSNGMVIGRGLIQTPSVPGQNLFTIPVGYRPGNSPYARIFNTATNNTANNESMRVYTQQAITAGYGVGKTAWTLFDQFGVVWISLDGFLWMAEQ